MRWSQCEARARKRRRKGARCLNRDRRAKKKRACLAFDLTRQQRADDQRCSRDNGPLRVHFIYKRARRAQDDDGGLCV